MEARPQTDVVFAAGLFVSGLDLKNDCRLFIQLF